MLHNGVKAVIAKMKPLKLHERITQLVGKVEQIYIAGSSLKVYCLSEEQKSKLLSSTQLGETTIKCSELENEY